MHISASQINTFLQCRLRWWADRNARKDVTTDAMAVGTLVHCVIGKYHARDARTDEILSWCLKMCVGELPQTYTLDQVDRAKSLLNRFYKQFGADSDVRPTAIEKELVVPNFIEGVDLVLIPDDYTELSDSIHFNEYKTSGSKPFPYNDLIFKHGMQGIVYKVGLELALGKPVTHCDFTFIWDGGAVRERREFMPSDYWVQMIKNIAHEIRGPMLRDMDGEVEGSYPNIYPTPSILCGYCPYQDPCRQAATIGVDAKELML